MQNSCGRLAKYAYTPCGPCRAPGPGPAAVTAAVTVQRERLRLQLRLGHIPDEQRNVFILRQDTDMKLPHELSTVVRT